MSAGRAVVVGGGVAGLATAALLAREGRSVTLLEGRDELGGRVGSWSSGGFRFDTGPSWYLMPEVFDHFFRLLGTSTDAELDLVTLDPGYRVLFEDAPPLDVLADRAANVRLFESVERGAGRRLEQYLDSAEEAYGLALEHFLYTTYDSVRPLATGSVARRLPRLARLLTTSLERHVAARFRDPRLRQVLAYPAVFLGSSPRLTPAMYHLMSRLDLADGVRYPRGGFVEVVAALERAVRREGVDVRTGATVTAVTTGAPSGRRRGVRARATGVDYVRGGRRHHLAADVVVSTADLHHTETALLPPALRTWSDRWWRQAVPGPSAVLVLLGVRGELPQLAHHTLLFTRDWDRTFDRVFPRERGVRDRSPLPDPTSLYVCRPSATDPGVAPPGTENLFVLVPVPPDPGLGRGGVDGAGDRWVEATADAAVAQVAAWAGVPDLAERVLVRRTIGPADFAADLHSWHGTALGPAHTLRQSAMLRASGVSRRVEGLLYAGGSVAPGIGLPMCLISAELVVKRLRGDVSTGPLAEPLGPVGAAAAPRAVPREARREARRAAPGVVP